MRAATGALFTACLALLCVPASGLAAKPVSTSTAASAERGYQLLTTKAYLPPDFTDDVFAEVWKVWPEPLRSQAEQASPGERRRMAFSRYGMMESPDHPDGPALGYVDNGAGGWVMNCLACHGGKVAGRVIAGLPNSHYALHTLTSEISATKAQMGIKLGHMDLGALAMPLGTSNGTTNAVVFGVALGACRDADLNFHRDYPAHKLVHHDMDAPPLWNVKKKSHLYCDGFAPRDHRALLQFLLIPQHDAKTLKSWEQDYRHVLAWIESLEPPRWPWEIDARLAEAGEQVFQRSFARCHGTYGREADYPNRVVPLDEIGTDPIRLRALSVKGRHDYGAGWFGHYGELDVVDDPVGYVAPPLDGVWASAPYLHNGSVPTLWHLLHPDQRPTVWQRSEDGYDRARGGLEIETFDQVPTVKTFAERRTYFDTTAPGKSAAGHDFPSALTEAERTALLEYLTTL